MIRYKFMIVGLLVALPGCGANTTAESESPKVSAAAAKYVTATEPAAAKSVTAAKTAAKDGESVTLVGRIGGSVSPFVAGRAAFTIVDTELVPCSERPGDSCETPWDYCCDTDRLPAGTAIIKIVDDAGATVALDAKKDLALKELQTVVVQGTAKRDEAGNLTVLAPAVFVRK